MECKYCGEKDESRLVMSTRVVNGQLEDADVCLGCLWFKEFEHEGENGKLLSKKKNIERTESAGSSNTINLQKGAKLKR